MNELLDVSGQDLMSVEAKIMHLIINPKTFFVEVNKKFIDGTSYLSDESNKRRFIVKSKSTIDEFISQRYIDTYFSTKC